MLTPVIRAAQRSPGSGGKRSPGDPDLAIRSVVKVTDAPPPPGAPSPERPASGKGALHRTCMRRGPPHLGKPPCRVAGPTVSEGGFGGGGGHPVGRRQPARRACPQGGGGSRVKGCAAIRRSRTPKAPLTRECATRTIRHHHRTPARSGDTGTHHPETNETNPPSGGQPNPPPPTRPTPPPEQAPPSSTPTPGP